MIKKACELQYGDIIYSVKNKRCYRVTFIHQFPKGIGFKPLKRVSNMGYIGISFGDKTWNAPMNQLIPVVANRL